MNIQTYLEKTGTKRAAFARSIGVSPDLVYQWIKGIRPIAAPHCKPIHAATGGKVTLKELRPGDWDRLWPELVPPPRKRRTTTPK